MTTSNEGSPGAGAGSGGRPLGRRERLLIGAVALTLVGGVLAAGPVFATEKPPDRPIGEEEPSPTVPVPPLPPPGSLQNLLAQIGVNRQCPPPGPGGPAMDTSATPVQSGRRTVRIVVTGDSYMSGEGAGDYYNKKGQLVPPMIPGPGGVSVPPPGYTLADYETDWRHRSANAPVLLAIDELRRRNPDVDFKVRFNASSGARSTHYFAAQNDHGRVNGPQYTGIDAGTDLVIAGFGGNDAGFGPLVEKAAQDNDTAGLSALAKPYLDLLAPRSEAVEWADAITPGTPASLVSRYVQMVRDMHQAGKKARVLMVTYPQGVRTTGGSEWILDRLLTGSERQLLASLAPKLSDAMRRAQQILVNHGIQMDLLDVRNAFKGHELGTDDPYVNDVTFTPAGDVLNAFQETAHPNRRGAQLLATYYAQMIASELGVWAPQKGTVPAGRATRPCLSELPPPGTGTSGGSSAGTASGGGGGGSGGGASGGGGGSGGSGSSGGTAAGGGTAGSGGSTGSGGGTGTAGGTGNGDSGNGGYGDIDPVTPVTPTDPSIPDGLEGDSPYIPVNPVPPAPPGSGGEPPLDLPPVDVIIIIN